MKAIKKEKRIPKWRKNCSVCQYSKVHREFKARLFASSYYNDNSTESPMDVNRAYGSLFSQTNLYACLKRHHPKDIVPSKIVNGELLVDNRVKPTFEVVEKVPEGMTEAEIGLDELIKKGRAKVAAGELQITTTAYLTALKTKLDNDAKTKDRRADLLSGLFKGAAPKDV